MEYIVIQCLKTDSTEYPRAVELSPRDRSGTSFVKLMTEEEYQGVFGTAYVTRGL